VLEREVEQHVEVVCGVVIAFTEHLRGRERLLERLLGLKEVVVHPGLVGSGEWHGGEVGGE
jgi:O-succinylbenzoate synthase